MTAAALDGIVVLDLGQVYAGPYCTHLLRGLGATVVKIEPPGGEPIRWRGGGGDDPGAAFLLLNAGKQGVALDLKSDRGRQLFLDLVARADVVVENFAPGVLDRLGLGWDALHAVRPELVLASCRAFGAHPSTEGLRGMDITVQAVTGIVSSTGFPDGPPVKAGGAVVDFAAGTHLAAAVLAALFQRERTGRGQHVEVAMQDAVLPSLASNIAGLLESDGGFPERTGNRHGGLSVCPYNVYPVTDGWLAVLCLRPVHWQALCAVMGRADLAADAGLATPAGRVARMDDVDAAVAGWTATVDAAAGLARLQQAGVPAAPVKTLAEVMADPGLRDRGMLAEIGEGDRRSTVLGNPIQLSDSSVATPRPAPRLGEDTDAVLRDLLGLAARDIEHLHADGVVVGPST